MGERIKQLRIEKGWTQEYLGQLIGVQKAAIKKYEKGEVENIKRSKIKVMADAFGVHPTYLMGWDEEYNHDDQLTKEVKLIEEIQNRFGKTAVHLLNAFEQLNDTGKEKALENISDLVEIPKYTEI